MIEAGGFDANERFARFQWPQLFDLYREHFRPTCAGGSGNATPGRNVCIRHGYNVSNRLYCVSLHFTTWRADEQTKAFAQKDAAAAAIARDRRGAARSND